MTSVREDGFSSFEALILLWERAYQCAVVSYVALKTAEGPHLLVGRVVFETIRRDINDGHLRLETEHVIAAHFVHDLSSSDIKTCLAFAEDGQIDDAQCQQRISLKSDGNRRVFFFPIHHPAFAEGPRLPTLIISGSARHEVISTVADVSALDWELKGADTPFDTLDELLAQCGLPAQRDMGDLTTLEILANPPVMVSPSSRLAEGDAVLECTLAAALDVQKLKLGYKLVRKNSVERKSVLGTMLEWRKEGEVRAGSYRISAEGAPLIQTFVSYAGISQHQWWIADEKKRLNPRHAIHQTFDDDLEVLRQILSKPDADKAPAFENAVSLLINLLGFSASLYGRIPKLQKGPDIIAVAPSGHVGVIECTIGLLDANDKLGKLVQRTTRIRGALDSAGYSFLRVQPIIVTSLSREEVKANLDSAGKHKIAVVCKEDIYAMLQQVAWPPNADRWFDASETLIPGVRGAL